VPNNGKVNPLTAEGLKKLQERLEDLKSTKRAEIAQRIKDARVFGDISENAEYDDAKNEQAKVEAEIATLEEKLKNVKIIDEEDARAGAGSVTLGSKVKVLDVDMKEKIVYHIVGSLESSPEDNKISNESPLGTALLGKTPKQTVEVAAPGGTIKYRILEILK
jgi:transcription elongation factor GreA